MKKNINSTCNTPFFKKINQLINPQTVKMLVEKKYLLAGELVDH
jgi:hypothetical protein